LARLPNRVGADTPLHPRYGYRNRRAKYSRRRRRGRIIREFKALASSSASCSAADRRPRRAPTNTSGAQRTFIVRRGNRGESRVIAVDKALEDSNMPCVHGTESRSADAGCATPQALRFQRHHGILQLAASAIRMRHR